jgi:hypothetical protein
MTSLAADMHFEEAQKIKEKIEILDTTVITIVNPKSPILMCFRLFQMKRGVCEFPKIFTVPSFVLT